MTDHDEVQRAARIVRVPNGESPAVTPIFFTPHGHGRRACTSQEILDAVDALRPTPRKTQIIDGSTKDDT